MSDDTVIWVDEDVVASLVYETGFVDPETGECREPYFFNNTEEMEGMVAFVPRSELQAEREKSKAVDIFEATLQGNDLGSMVWFSDSKIYEVTVKRVTEGFADAIKNGKVHKVEEPDHE